MKQWHKEQEVFLEVGKSGDLDYLSVRINPSVPECTLVLIRTSKIRKKTLEERKRRRD